METIHIVLLGMGGELDRLDIEVRDSEDCLREILAAITRESWVLSVGDRIEIQRPE